MKIRIERTSDITEAVFDEIGCPWKLPKPSGFQMWFVAYEEDKPVGRCLLEFKGDSEFNIKSAVVKSGSSYKSIMSDIAIDMNRFVSEMGITKLTTLCNPKSMPFAVAYWFTARPNHPLCHQGTNNFYTYLEMVTN